MNSDADLNTLPAGDPLRLALRPRDAARALGLGERKLWELTNCNEIPHIKLGKCILYPVDALRDWLTKKAAKVTR